VQQLLQQTAWGNDLDYLVLDLPPGTGDIHLTVAQTVAVTAAVMVTTPHTLSLVDVEKGVRMFESVKIPTIGLVENYAHFHCPNCSHKSEVFRPKLQPGTRYSSSKQLADQFGLKFFHQLPINPKIAVPHEVYTANEEVQEEPAWQVFKGLAEDVERVTESKEFRDSKLSFHLKWDPHGVVLMRKASSASGAATEGEEELGKVSHRKLRMACRSASMWDEFTGKKLFRDEDIPHDVRIVGTKESGAYAIQIEWSDGHSSLFPWTKIKEFCS